jgi:hypothetical protein
MACPAVSPLFVGLCGNRVRVPARARRRRYASISTFYGFGPPGVHKGFVGLDDIGELEAVRDQQGRLDLSSPDN